MTQRQNTIATRPWKKRVRRSVHPRHPDESNKGTKQVRPHAFVPILAATTLLLFVSCSTDDSGTNESAADAIESSSGDSTVAEDANVVSDASTGTPDSTPDATAEIVEGPVTDGPDANVGSNTVMIGHSFPRDTEGSGRPGGPGGRGGSNWVSDHPVRGCAPGADLEQNGAGTGNCVGCNGGYGAIYCFAM